MVELELLKVGPDSQGDVFTLACLKDVVTGFKPGSVPVTVGFDPRAVPVGKVQALRLEGQDNALQRPTRPPGRRMHDLCPQESAASSALAVRITSAHSPRLVREQRPHRRGVDGGKPPQAS